MAKTTPPAGVSRPVPLRALLLSVASLSVPVVAVLAFPSAVQEDQGMLIWLTSLVPAFLLAYYRGLRGVALAVAGGMAVLALTQVTVLLFGRAAPNWTLLLVIVAVYVGVCIALAIFAEVLHRERQAAEGLALVDVLTGLPNRRHAEVTLDAQFAAAARGRKLVVVLFDLDHFKQVNDRHGHEAGDTALRAFADILKRNTRRMDLSARFGGEEFLVVLTDIELRQVLILANRVREDIRAQRFDWGQVTVSGGAAEYQDGMGSYEVLVAAADHALYAAKQAGRDRVEAAARVVADATPAPRAEPAAAPGAPAPRSAETILLVDDDLDMLRFVSRMLQRSGYRVEQTDDPEAVIRRYEGDTSGVDLLITDVMMPRMNGLTMVDRISKVFPQLRVIYLSGYLQGEVSWAGLPGAVVGFVAKPVGTELLGVVREVLDRPLPAPDSPRLPAITRVSQRVNRDKRPIHVLIVDDDAGVRQTYSRVLERAGFVVTAVDNGFAALAALRESSFHVILCDWGMPFLEGQKLYDELRHELPAMAARVVFVTGHADDEGIRQFVRATGQPLIGKPPDFAELVRVVREIAGDVVD